jgi:hypothetical protein
MKAAEMLFLVCVVAVISFGFSQIARVGDEIHPLCRDLCGAHECSLDHCDCAANGSTPRFTTNCYNYTTEGACGDLPVSCEQ